MDSEVGISQAAKVLGVSVSTLKRLCDEGLIESVRTPGGHRRFSQREIQLMGQRLLGQAGKYLAAIHSDVREKLVFMLLAGNEPGSVELLTGLAASPGHLPQVLDEYLVPAIHSLGSKVEVPSQVKLAEQTAERVLDRLGLQSAAPQPTGPVAVGVSAGNDWGDLGSKLVEASLRLRRIYAMNLGAVRSIDQLIRLTAQFQLKAVWLAIVHHQAFADLATLSHHLRERLPPTVPVIIYIGCPDVRFGEVNGRAYYSSLHQLVTDYAAGHLWPPLAEAGELSAVPCKLA